MNSTLRKGMKSEGYNSFGNSSISQCIRDFGYAYAQNEECYMDEENGPKRRGLFGNHFGNTELIIGVQRVSTAIAQGSWNDGQNRIARDFFITKLLSQTNCVWQSRFWGSDLLHHGDDRAIKEVIGLHSKDCKGGSSISNRAASSKRNMLVNVGAHQHCYAAVENTVQKFANNDKHRCDIHIYIQGEYSTTILRQISDSNKNAQRAHDNHQPDLFIDV